MMDITDDVFFFFNDTATTQIYTYLHTLSLHDALPILLSELHAVHHFHAPGSGDILNPVVGGESKAQFIIFGGLRCDQDHPIRTSGPVNSSRSGILQNGNAFYIGSVQVSEIGRASCRERVGR